MEHPVSSDSIIYLSPSDPRYPLKDPPNFLLLDEPVPPHFQNRFDPILTPERQLRSASRHLEKSSSSKPLPAPVRPQHSATHPFAHFEDDNLDPALLSKGKEEAEREGASGECTVRKPRKYEQAEIGNMLASPKKRGSGGKTVKKEPLPALDEQYQELLNLIRQEEPFTLPELFFFRGEEDASLSKLLCFQLNAKNGRYVRYDPRSKTCHSLYKCLGCNRTFTVAAALGGHLSKCPDKLLHVQRTNNHSRRRGHRPKLQEGSEWEDDLEVEVKVEAEEQNPIVVKKEPEEPAYRGGRRAVRMVRTRAVRAARLRANAVIREMVQAHFE